MNGLVARAQNIYLRPRIHKKNGRHLETELEKFSFEKYVEGLRSRVLIPVRPFLHNLSLWKYQQIYDSEVVVTSSFIIFK